MKCAKHYHVRLALATLVGGLLAPVLVHADQAGGGMPLQGIWPAGSTWPKQVEETISLSSFGERPAFSPDSKRIAFIGKTYGDAYEIDLATRKLRNRTKDIPHQGFLRVHYLPNGDFIFVAPHVYKGPISRAETELWVLDKSGEYGLMPLNQNVFEGIAVSRLSNKIVYAIQTSGGFLGDPNTDLTKFRTRLVMADIAYDDQGVKLVNKRPLPTEEHCQITEPQGNMVA